eukprot:scaffold1090_cov179-Ochromonas_danica.AAC.1
MECKSISCESSDEDSDENALPLSFIFSSCSSSSFSSGSSSNMFEYEVPQTLVRLSNDNNSIKDGDSDVLFDDE